MRLLHLVAGVSYYKAAVPHEIAVDGPGARPRDRPGPRAAVDGRARASSPGTTTCRGSGSGIRFPAAGDAPPPAPPAGLAPRSLVPIGGGKDSAVALAALARAGEDVMAFSVGRKPSADATAAAEGVPMRPRRAPIGPGALRTEPRAARYNGHVPITAIVTCAAVVAALILAATRW